MAKKNLLNFVCLMTFLISSSLYAQPGCPNINAGANTSVDCDNVCVQLSASYLRTGATNSYEVSSIPYNPPYPYNQGSNIIMNIDDRWSSLLNLPFDFCFFGQSYNKVTVGSNGVISFNQSYANSYCPWSFSVSCPSTSLPLNSIFCPYHDIDPDHYSISSNGTIKYAILGSIPCRTFVLSYDQVPLYSCGAPRATHQVVFYETTNVIEVYIQTKGICSSWNGGRGIIGIQNQTGNIGYAPAGRNGTQWTASNEAWRFTPNGPSNVVVDWLQGGTVFGSGDTITVCPSVNTTYTARATYNNCNGSVVVENDDVLVSFQNNLNPVLSPANPVICKDSLLNLTISGGTSYEWSHGLGTSSVVAVSPSSTTTYSVTVTKGVCSVVKNVQVVVNPIPVISLTNSMPVICEGQSSLLTASGASTYTWSPSVSLSSSTGASVTATPTSTTTYTVTGTANACYSVATTTVQVNPIPVIEISPASASICPGETVALSASGAGTYNWSPASGLSATNQASVNASPAQTQDYTVSGTLNACTGTATVSVVVKPKPIMTANPASSDICMGDSVLVTVGIADTYQWMSSADLNVIANNQAYASPVENTTYNVIGTTDDCVDSVQFVVNVINNPSISIDPSEPEICPGESVTLTASGGLSYTWSPENGLNSTNTESVVASPSETTTYSVIGTTSGCSGMTSVTIVIKPKPVLSISPSLATLCCGDSVLLSASGCDLFQWCPSSGLSATNTECVVASPTESTIYKLIGTLNGCVDSMNVSITVNPLPDIDILSDFIEGCQPLLINFSVNSNPSAQQFFWSFGNGQTSSMPNPTVGYANAGQYDVNVEVIDVNNCRNSLTVPQMINVYPKPEIDFTITPPIGTQQAISTFQSSYTQSPATWFWKFGDGTELNVITSQIIHTYMYAGEFVVTHMLETQYGCRDTVEKTYIVDLEVTVPNIFTPNNDGYNDNFVISGIEYLPNCHLKVYNRWGRIVYENENYKNDWDGGEVAEGTYYFILTLPITDFVPISGTVSVFR